MKKIFYGLGSSILVVLSALSCVWLYYNIRYQIVYIQSIPFERDRWENTINIILPKQPMSANQYLTPVPPPAR